MKPIIPILIFISLLLISCNRDNSKELKIRHIHVLFPNGNVFCDGNHGLLSGKEDAIRVGVWKFYYPSGQLESEFEYDSSGERVRYNGYSETGVLIHSSTQNEDLEMQSDFFDSGIIESEITKKTDYVKSEDSGEEKEETEYIKEYYSNGHIKREYQRVDGAIEGIVKVWDLSGNLAIKINYHNGLIQQ
jgi:antitoxin component YwqK of YwqJK toxin-antitoxin module